MANLSSKPSSYPPPEGLLWGESEPNPARKALERAPELKGVFGAGASNVTRPKAAVSAAAPHDAAASELPVDSEQRRARAKAHGLWNNAARGPSEPLPASQPRLDSLPLAVLGNVAAVANDAPPQLGRHAARGMHADTTIVSANMTDPRHGPRVIPAQWLAEAQQANQPANQNLAEPERASAATPLPEQPEVSFEEPAPQRVEPRGRRVAAAPPDSAFEPDTAADGGERTPFQVPDLPRPETRARTFEPAEFNEAPSVFPPAGQAGGRAQSRETSGARAVDQGEYARSMRRDEARGRERHAAREAEHREAEPSVRPPRPEAGREPTGRREVRETAEAEVLERVAARVRASQRPKSRAPRVLATVLICALLLAAAAFGAAWAGLWHLPGSATKPGRPLETQTAPSLNASPPKAKETTPQHAEVPAVPQPEAAKPATAPAPGQRPGEAEGGIRGQLHEARRLLRERKPAAAEAVLHSVLEQAPNDLTSATLLTQAYISQHKGPEALQSAEKLVDKRPKRAVFHVLLGDARQLNGDRAGAIEAFQAALTLDPNSREAKQRLARFSTEAKPE